MPSCLALPHRSHLVGPRIRGLEDIPISMDSKGASPPEVEPMRDIELTNGTRNPGSQELGARLKQATGEPRSAAFFRQRVALEVQRGNAALLSGALPTGVGLEEIFFL